MDITLIYLLRIRMKLEITKYLPVDNNFKSYIDKKVIFPLNHIIQGEISLDDNVNVILIETTSPERNTIKFVDEAKSEIISLLQGKCKNLTFDIVKAPYTSSRLELGNIYKNLCSAIKPNSAIYADVTFGPKYLPIITFCSLNYSEKYLGCEVRQLLYGLFDENKTKRAEISDFTTLYLLNSFGSIFNGSKESFDSFANTLLS